MATLLSQKRRLAEELRLAGNAAAHEVDSGITLQDAGDLVHFTHALLEYVFTLRERFRQFQERRKKAEE